MPLSAKAKMSSSFPSFLLLLFLFLTVVLVTTSSVAQAQTQLKNRSLKSPFSAIYVFGDSTVDPGNNNYIKTLLKSNFTPYGRDFPNHKPTGRFTNGRLATDFIASYLGLKEFVPPYLDKTLSLQELMTGVSFASAGSGYDPLTSQLASVIDISKQLDYFREYKTRLEQAIGKKKTANIIEKSGVVISSGSDDFMFNYFLVPIRQLEFTVDSYQQFLIQNLWQTVESLWKLGVRKIAVSGLPPLGCLPLVITLNPINTNEIIERGCIEKYSSAARDYNQKLQVELATMKKHYAKLGGRIVYVDIYQPLLQLIQGHKQFGFKEWRRGCCGTGLVETTFLCNLKSPVCPDASKYIFWDSVHPTERTYFLIFNTFNATINTLLN
ncbi:PREDICTED: GDSL esterase/lipase At5g45960-like [Nelumbo nucifera]|uniref:GDSL esterase/lipase At5g45960-like n=1 Tax=Nelumbo nucifera TaxID=4432 RepID=A0A1U8ADU9_NELNU|nr:PREDICTED: GDSL esterase/lipase At5g45960-like [Nelumbo nucifera]